MGQSLASRNQLPSGKTKSCSPATPSSSLTVCFLVTNRSPIGVFEDKAKKLWVGAGVIEGVKLDKTQYPTDPKSLATICYAMAEATRAQQTREFRDDADPT